MQVEDILADLVAIPSVVGTPNGAIVDYVREILSRAGVASTVISGPEGDRSNLFASIGPAVPGGVVLSAHLDVVPANEPDWTSSPFRLRADGERLVARGAVDMKGFVAAVLASVRMFQAHPLARPVHLAFSYDEEAGCVGVRHLIARLPSLCAPPSGCIVGEPTGMRPVLRHKGKAALRVTVHGRAAHSARPDLGLNAIHAAAGLVAAVREKAAELARKGPFNPQFEPPSSTLQVGVIAGGSALNIVPERCLLDIEARAIPGSDPKNLLAVLDGSAACLREAGFRIETETLGGYPALDLAEDHPLAALAEEIAGRSRAGAVSFGTEAGLYQEAGVPAIVCGPGDIARAHRADEYVLRGELAEAMQALQRLARRLAA